MVSDEIEDHMHVSDFSAVTEARCQRDSPPQASCRCHVAPARPPVCVSSLGSGWYFGTEGHVVARAPSSEVCAWGFL